MIRGGLALWGGVECTVNRVGDRTPDQLRLTGHHHRLDDLDRIADLGLRTLRVPILWERTEVSQGSYNWDWADARMERLRNLGVRPIVGLVHHGSGPVWTDLTQRSFVAGLARFAQAAARRYPWVLDWTPVNEPITTARFSCLYGHWHPHLRDERAFWTAVLNQIDAVVASMGAVRSVNAGARLIQTEDFGRTFSTQPCADQALFDHDRRLMTWDLLCGQVGSDHPLRKRLEAFGFGDRLASLADSPNPPDVIGLNHYVTSDRFLDHRIGRYPAHLHGGNGRMAYVDTEAVRVMADWTPRWRDDLAFLWTRYGRPVAVTECHLGCSPDQQIAWLDGCWKGASAARASGVPVEAVTVWALLGSVGWDRLLTETEGL
jgi:dTDP-4-dehydrorhamnose reductase